MSEGVPRFSTLYIIYVDIIIWGEQKCQRGSIYFNTTLKYKLRGLAIST